ncbi:MAG: PilN domain-containing protein [Gammaproteobacteria bacterium]
MNQQINLFQPIFRKQKKVFSAGAMVQLLGIVVLGLFLIWAFSAWQVSHLSAELANLHDQQRDVTSRLTSINKAIPPRTPTPALADAVERARTEKNAKARAVTLLSGRKLGNATGVSPMLAGLARQHLRPLWLTDIDISEGGTALRLGGRTTEPESVPAYLQGLSKEDVFRGTEFRSFRMSRPEKERRRDVIEFTLSTALPEEARHERSPG